MRLDCYGYIGLIENTYSKQETRLKPRARNCQTLEILCNFLDSDAKIAIIRDWEREYVSLESLRNTIISVIKRVELEDRVRCFSIKGVVYLVRL